VAVNNNSYSIVCLCLLVTKSNTVHVDMHFSIEVVVDCM